MRYPGSVHTPDPTATPPGDLRERRRAETGAQITAATLTLIEREGIERTTVADIAREAGISPRTFFRYFPSKEAAAVNGQIAFTAAIQALASTEPAPASALDAIVANMRAGAPLLPQLESAYRRVLLSLERERGDTREQLFRIRTLMLRHASLRAASLLYEDNNDLRLARALSERPAPAADLDECLLIVHAASFALRITFDEWVRRSGELPAVSLTEIYDRVTSLQRRVLGA